MAWQPSWARSTLTALRCHNIDLIGLDAPFGSRRLRGCRAPAGAGRLPLTCARALGALDSVKKHQDLPEFTGRVGDLLGLHMLDPACHQQTHFEYLT